MKRHILLFFITAIPFFTHAEYVIESALTQNDKCLLVEESENYSLYRIIPNPTSNFSWPYLLKVSKSLTEANDLHIMLEMVNSGTTTDSFRFLQERALRSIRRGYRYDKEFVNRFIFMMPLVPRPASSPNFYTHALDRDCFFDQEKQFQRIDLQVIAMIEDAGDVLATNLNIEVQKKVGIRGFSACGVFAQRFSAIHPEKVKFCISGGFAGMPLLPIEALDGRLLTYPVGIGDFEELMGKEFDFEAYSQVPRFFHMGAIENNDSVDYSDAYDRQERDLINELLGENPPERWTKTTRILNQFETENEFHTDEGVGHAYSDEMKDKIENFITKQLKRRR